MKLLIFTQKVDRNDVVLGFFHEWLFEFSKRCESIIVICLYKGEYDLPKNVKVLSLGKEAGTGKLSYLVNLYHHLQNTNGTYDRVFVHMNPIYLVLCGWYFKWKKIPVYMWYVHRSVDWKLKIATKFTTKVFSSAKESFRIETSKVIFLGHGIDVAKLPNTSHLFTGNVLKIVHIGRITAIKNIEVLLEAGALLKKRDLKIQLTFWGDCVTEKDRVYKKSLEMIIAEKGLQNEVFFAGAMQHQDLAQKLIESHITVNMTPPGGMDKVVLESILLGIPTFTSNTAFKGVFGADADMFMYQFQNSKDLADKIVNYTQQPQYENIMEELNKKVRAEFGLESLIDKMVSIMK